MNCFKNGGNILKEEEEEVIQQEEEESFVELCKYFSITLYASLTPPLSAMFSDNVSAPFTLK